MPSSLHSEIMSLERLLSANCVLRVPDFQRPYSWTAKEAEQLVDDLCVALDDVGADGTGDDYFLGSVLLVDRTGPVAGTQIPSLRGQGFDIIDGQQRLVTITILLAVLRDLSADRGVPMEAFIRPMLWTETAAGGAPDGAGEMQPRLQLRGSEGQFLLLYAQHHGASMIMPIEEELTEAEHRMLTVREHLLETLAMREGAELQALARYLARSCTFCVLTTHNLDRAHHTFHVLNNRGRPLSRKDILKAQILSQMEPAARQRRLEVWDRIEARLGDDLDELLSYIRTIEGRGRMRARLIDDFSDLVRSRGSATAFFDETFEPYARIYEAIAIRPLAGPEGPEPIARYLRGLGWLGSGEWKPAAMLFWRLCNGDRARLEPFLQRLDRLAYGLRLLGLGLVKRQTRFAALLAALRAGESMDAPEGPLQLSREELRNINYNLRNLHVRSQITCKLVLLRVSAAMDAGGLDLDPTDYTVEHVLPQRPSRTSQWRTWFPSADEREACTHSLGNLALVTRGENDRARNMELPRKLAIYFANGVGSALPITREFAGIAEWRPAHVLAREERVMALIQQLWNLEPARNPATGVAADPVRALQPIARRARGRDAAAP